MLAALLGMGLVRGSRRIAADVSVAGGIPMPMGALGAGVICDTPSASVAQGSRPGNFKIVIQNILYLDILSATRCSVSSTGRTRITAPTRQGDRPGIGVKMSWGTWARSFDPESRATGILGLDGPLNVVPK
jgi:hypothetical protein